MKGHYRYNNIEKNIENRLNEFEKVIGYKFNNQSLLYRALTHSSYANEMKRHGKNNERLEFLGDSVLSIVVSDYLYRHFKHLPEGELTRVRASLVCEKALFEFANQIRLSDFILLGKGEMKSHGNERPSIVSDAFEALIAAIYLDGGLEAAKKHIMKFMPDDIISEKKDSNDDYKSILQEIIQRNPEESVEYRLVAESGPDHDKKFTIRVMLNSNVIGEGTGRSKKIAEQSAAKEALELMGYGKM